MYLQIEPTQPQPAYSVQAHFGWNVQADFTISYLSIYYLMMTMMMMTVGLRSLRALGIYGTDH